MLTNDFDLAVVEGGRWCVDGDGPAGFSLPAGERYWGLGDLSPVVDLALRRLGLELVAVKCDTVNAPTRAHVVYRRPE
jgi:hypothetical protein